MSKVPKLRFKEFSGEWEEKKLSDVSTITTGSTPSTVVSEYYGGEKLFVSPVDMQGNRYVKTTKTTLTLKGFEQGRKIPKNSIFFVCIGSTIGKIGQAFKECITNQQINSLTASTKNENDFIFSLLEVKAPKIRLLAGEQAVPQINKSDFSKLSFSFPDKQEQKKIASFFSAIDSKINQLTHKKELLKEYKKGIIQKIFSQELRFKAEDGSQFPEWEEKILGEITKKISIKNKDNQNLPVYSISNKHGFIPQGEQFEGVDSSSRNYDISMYKIVGKNMFAYNPARINVGSIGYSGDLENVIISSLYVCFQTAKQINDSFFLQFLETFEFKKQVIRNTEGGVRDYLFYENFSNIKTKLPSFEEQTKIANFLSVIDTKIDFATKQLEEVKKFKKGLLQQMFV